MAFSFAHVLQSFIASTSIKKKYSSINARILQYIQEEKQEEKKEDFVTFFKRIQYFIEAIAEAKKEKRGKFPCRILISETGSFFKCNEWKKLEGRYKESLKAEQETPTP